MGHNHKADIYSIGGMVNFFLAGKTFNTYTTFEKDDNENKGQEDCDREEKDIWDHMIKLLSGEHVPLSLDNDVVPGRYCDYKRIHRRTHPYQQLSVNCFDFLKKCSIVNPEKRISAVEALNHPWITEPSRRRRLIQRLLAASAST